MGYNPGVKRIFSLEKEKECKNQKELRYIVPKILRMLALNRIDLEKDGHWFFDKIMINTMIDVTRERAERLYWDYQSYNGYIFGLEQGYLPALDRETGARVIRYRNDIAAKYNAYNTAYIGLSRIKIEKNMVAVAALANALRVHSKYF